MASLLSTNPLSLPIKPIPFLHSHKPSPLLFSPPTTTKPTLLAYAASSPPLSTTTPNQINEDPTSHTEPPLVCCFGAAQREFIPMVRVSDRRMHPDQYSDWKMLHWDPPEFARAPGGPVSNVAMGLARLGGRVAFMGKLGDDDFGMDLMYELNKEKVQTRAVEMSEGVKTGTSYMKLEFRDREDGKGKKLVAETVKDCAEDSFLESDINVDVLKEARMFHFNSEALLTPWMHSTLFKAMNISKSFGGDIFFDPNLPLPLWKSRDETLDLIKPAWLQSNIIEVSRHELEFLLDEPYFVRKRTVPPQYYAESVELMKTYNRDYYHYTKDDLAPLWHDGIKLLIVTHGTLRIHYYTQEFDGFVIGTEDAILAPSTCDRSGSGDAIVAAVMRKLVILPEMYKNQDLLERQLRFAVAAGISSQWTNGAIRGLPTENAAQNLKEQVYIPSLW
ncbi:hypothetical protein LUZ61_007077 [Rhynchospora tenuis]|uniref:Carbohydrate kinase PfkB domain-containing protein n=1 Tax=Rhynchospora tenuis TaxID=198213 RepID=A0AAD5ZST1_9POAL|nr:hypothetical protein LUZ61_007077 [Rhynchospora tenuis]